MKHTPEPWENKTPGKYKAGNIYAEGEYICTTSGNAQANAERIVACVNACEGINPEAVPDLLEALKGIRAKVEWATKARVWSETEVRFLTNILDKARDAIALTKEKP